MPSRDFSVCSSHLRPQAAHRSHLGDLGVSIGLRRSLWNAALCLGYPRLTRVHISFEPWPFYLRDKSQNVTPKRELLWVAVSICSVTSSLERNCQESFFQTFFFLICLFSDFRCSWHSHCAGLFLCAVPAISVMGCLKVAFSQLVSAAGPHACVHAGMFCAHASAATYCMHIIIAWYMCYIHHLHYTYDYLSEYRLECSSQIFMYICLRCFWKLDKHIQYTRHYFSLNLGRILLFVATKSSRALKV